MSAGLALAVDPPELNSNYEAALWKDKFERLETQVLDMQKRNEQLEDRLLNIVEKTEGDKIMLSDEIDELSNRLIRANGIIARLEQECARYKSDCVLAVHLLHCQPSHYVAKKKLENTGVDQEITTSSPVDSDDSISTPRKFVASTVSTFPPMAIFYKPEGESEQPEDPLPSTELLSIKVVKPDEASPAASTLTAEFVERIRTDTSYTSVELRQCRKCGAAVGMATKETQTIGLAGEMGDGRRFPPVHECPERRSRVRSSDSNTSSETAI